MTESILYSLFTLAEVSVEELVLLGLILQSQCVSVMAIGD